MAAVVAEPSLDALPDSLLLEILSQLPLRERLRGARVCRRWCHLVQDKVLWRHVALTPYEISLKNLWHLLQHHLRSNVRTLKMRGTLSKALLQDLGKKCPGCQRLCLLCTKLRYKIDSYIVPSSLMTLELSCLELSQWIFFAKSEGTRGLLQLKHLFIYEVPSFSDLHLLNISSLACLQMLTLWNQPGDDSGVSCSLIIPEGPGAPNTAPVHPERLCYSLHWVLLEAAPHSGV